MTKSYQLISALVWLQEDYEYEWTLSIFCKLYEILLTTTDIMRNVLCMWVKWIYNLKYTFKNKCEIMEDHIDGIGETQWVEPIRLQF